MDRLIGIKDGEIMQEVIVTGKHYRVMTDLVNKVWSRVSYWKLARDVWFNSGKNLEETCGAIYGISDSLTSNSSNICASVKAVKELNDKIVALQNK